MFSIELLFVLTFWLINPNQAYSESRRIEALSRLVKDLIENEQVPSVLWASVCYSKSDEIYFAESISVPMQFSNSSKSIYLPINENTNKQWFFVDMTCELNSNFLSNVDETYFAHPYRWIIADAANNSIRNLALLPGSNVVLVNQDHSSDKYILKQVYKISRANELIHEEYGFWSRRDGLVDLRSTRILSRRRRNLRGHQFKAATVFVTEGSENYTDLDDFHHNKVDTISKISLLITKHWVESVNATMTIDVHRTWGYQDQITGLFSGMTGQLQRKDADIGGTIIFLTEERIDTLEYLSMQLKGTVSFILRAPPISYVSNIYYLPFTGIVWICSISLVILCTIAIASILQFRLSPDIGTETKKPSDYVLFAISSTCQMGSSVISNLLSARISMFCFYVALLFIFTSYTANIVALLQSTTKSIRTISDLQNPAIEIGIEDTPYNRFYFPDATEPSRKKLYDTRVAPFLNHIFMNLTHGISRMRKGMFAFHVENSPAYFEVERTFFENEKCGLVEIKFLGVSTDTWCVIQKRSPYKEILKVNMLKIREHAIQVRERTRLYGKRPKCDSDGKNFGSVRLIDCHAAMFIMIYGLLASFVIFCIEKFVHCKMIERLLRWNY